MYTTPSKVNKCSHVNKNVRFFQKFPQMSDGDSPELQKPTNIDQNKNTHERLLIFEGVGYISTLKTPRK